MGPPRPRPARLETPALRRRSRRVTWADGKRDGSSTRARLARRTESGWKRLLSVLPAQLRSMAKPLALSARIPGVGFRVTTLLLFLLLRFHDLVPVIQRRLEWMLLGGMLEARG
jgi:hypothetical protein